MPHLNPMPISKPTPPFPVETLELGIPDLPGELEGFTILHLSDLHITRPGQRLESVLAAVAATPHDLLVLTGDLMVKAGNEPYVHDWMLRLMQVARPRVGTAGVWGNHDSPQLRPRLQPLAVHWLSNAAWVVPGLPLTVLGVDCVEGEHSAPAGDLLGAMLSEQEQITDDRSRCRILLSHMPIWLPAAADLGIDLMLSGHTHGGQVRLPTGHVCYNATPGWPLKLSSGLLGCKQTQCAISRGLGEVYVNNLRIFCKPQLPFYVLQRAEKPIVPVNEVVQLQRW